ncbi:THAP domain-containing 9 [Olea europaea subsp. europaea]|uniref:THAP domain-containing 9, partial n=1 Tax=Olea europaea subsp. europaea TaxID=158383 RepID=A0A8S0TGJ4_OLEEU|nr:THAP domain-containing 9 [Olea europaea subsp. europaea]
MRRLFTLKTTHNVCSQHFRDEFLIKEDRYLINGERVCLPRLKWTLKSGAVPTIFPNLPSYLTKPAKSRKPPAQRSNLRSTSELSKRRKPTEHESSIGNSESNVSNISLDNEVIVGSTSNEEVREILIPKKKNDALKKRLALCRKKLSRSRKTVRELEDIVRKYKDQHLINISKCGKLQQEVIQTIIDKDGGGKTSVRGMRYPDNFLLECILFRIKSPKGYRHCKEHNLLPLPTPRSLSRLTSGVNITRLSSREHTL